ncbi:GNAT family N-acetyltransferase [Rhodovulum euryhalinum]|uniref:Putative acetyltransferase n=1 Tax=Rhodovulum euryhalinum TaxID=35805 RepID=A0A4R2KCH4_9RHOB|nr:GNAT family N-acetyltransferase [Rhodovulum euryhalinum]TCO69962.1 putative acetyltransferase [Rhodovulum euryhalinum]
MAVTIGTESVLSEDGRALVDASQAALLAVYPPEECFSFSAEELANKSTQFLVARHDGVPAGCVALVDQGGYGEVKRLYVDAGQRGRGIGRALMEELEAAARDIGLGLLRLETGEALEAAVRLYRAMGFVDCGPFGGYPDIPSNMFMEKRIGLCFRPRQGSAQVILA